MDTIDQVAIKRETAEGTGGAPAIAVENLHKSFGSQRVLDGISLTVKRGETLAVLGRSGTGKSVLLRLIIGLEKPDWGSVRIHGQDIAGLTLDQLADIRKKMGFLFQHAALYDSLTVGQNVAFPLQHHKKQMSESERSDRVKTLLAEVGLGENDFEKMPSDISGGMQKESDWRARWHWRRIFCCSTNQLRVSTPSAPGRSTNWFSNSRLNITWHRSS